MATMNLTPNTKSQRILYMTPTGKIVVGGRQTNTQNTCTSTRPYNDGVWHHVVGVGSASTLGLYVDGAPVGSTSGGQTALTSPRQGTWDVAFDSSAGWTGEPTSSYWKGSLDEVAIYNGTLTAARISAHYTAGH